MSDAPGELERAKEAALKRLKDRGRSIEEMRAFLVGKGFSVSSIDTTIADLTRVGLLGDAALAAEVTGATLRRAPAGRALLEHRLESRAIDEPVAQAEVDRATRGRSESADALTLARAEAPRALRLAGNDGPTALRRLLSLLARRGFEDHDAHEGALKALAELGVQPDADVE